MQPIIEMHNIFKSYGKGENQVKVLKGISLTVESGEFVAILGPSGSGKTTLMNLIGLIDTPDSGQYHIDGIDVIHLSDRSAARIRNRKIGFVFQKFNLIAKYNALHNVALPLLLGGASNRVARKKAMETLQRVGLSDRWHHRPNQLSGGQQQRVAIARALVGDCSLILADEPTGALDQKTGHDILSFLHQLNDEGSTIVIITHDPSIASAAKRIVQVEDGLVLSA
ncbi:MAG: ABC transporter ATP-binding protein [Bacillota bacterium]|nr:ABC transporter ATP-binding protein [Bacillota bacterium]